MKDVLTQERLKELLHYDLETGAWTWAVRRGRVQRGAKAGCAFRAARDGSLSKGYLSIGLDRRAYLAHRLAFLYVTGQWPAGQVDHVDHDEQNNRWANLRDVSGSANQHNLRKSKRNTSGETGVCWIRNRWRASIKVSDKLIYLGSFKSFEEAALARRNAKTTYHVPATKEQP